MQTQLLNKPQTNKEIKIWKAVVNICIRRITHVLRDMYIAVNFSAVALCLQEVKILFK
jgi:hypothetical protein